MFQNILFFIVALLLFNIHQPDASARGPLPPSLALLALVWAGFAIYCRADFRGLMRRIAGQGLAEGEASAYQRLVFKHSAVSIAVFTLALYAFEMKSWLQAVPFFRVFSVLQGAAALSFLLLCFSTVWVMAHPAYEVVYQPGMSRQSFVTSHLRLNLPILFPYILLTLVYDLIGLTPLGSDGGFLNRAEGQILLFAVFLAVLMVFLPALIRVFWGCSPLEAGERVARLRAFLSELGFRYREILRWPVFEGKMMTAGVMGLVPRYRYILVSDALMAALSLEELKAVMAHEAAHVKYRHLPLYLVFFVGFMAVSYGLYDVVLYLFFLSPPLTGLLAESGSRHASLFYLLLSLPMLAALLIYLRYVMGFFMRHFERQADLYSAEVMGSPEYTVRALEKIAFASGKSRDLPSWHHFSIRERVGCLLRTIDDPGLFRRHHRTVWVSFLIYLASAVALGYLLNFSAVKERMDAAVMERAIRRELTAEPENPALLRLLAMVYYERGRNREAADLYERSIASRPDDAVSLNNLSWLMLTAPEPDVRNDARALALAQKAVSLERSPVFLDTLAEAYYVNGFREKAIETIREAISLGPENRGYYEDQLKRFRSSSP